MEIPGLNVNNPSQTRPSESQKTIGSDDFLLLLMTQLRYQDPLNPIDNAEFTSQLAELSSLERLNSIDSSLENLLIYQNSLQNTLAIGLIGKEVEVKGNEVHLKDKAEINYSLSKNASTVKISIYDSNGRLVREIELKNQPSGDNTYLWDGKDSTGNPLPEGNYVVTVNATDPKGQPIEVTTKTRGTVTGLTFENNTTYLVIDGNLKVQLGDVKTITTGGL